MRRGSYFTLFCLALAISVGLTPVVAQDASVEPTEEPFLIQEVAPVRYTRGDQLLKESFDNANAWENYSSDTGVILGVDSGDYKMHIPAAMADNYYWAVNATSHTDVIIQARFSQAQDDRDSEFGLVCRVNSADDGNGYYFIIGGDGSGYIGKAPVDEDVVNALSDTVDSPAVNAGAAENIVRAVCVGDYLALYVNDKLVAQAYDDEFTSGFAGLTVLSGPDMDADIVVDNLTIDAAIASAQAPETSATSPLPELKGVEAGAVLFTETFDDEDSWEVYTSDDNEMVHPEAGAYRIFISRLVAPRFMWGQREAPQRDIIVQATVTLDGGPVTSSYGVMCRADPEKNSAGYYFGISGDGYFSLRARSMDGDTLSVNPLVDWTLSSIIHQGYASNELTAVCARDYLALYVNGALLADAHDSTFTSGELGLAASLFDEGDLEVSFDDVSVYSAQLS